MFGIVRRILEEKDSHKDGTCTDATIIKAPSSTKNQEKKRDPEMSSTKKVPTINSEWKPISEPTQSQTHSYR